MSTEGDTHFREKKIILVFIVLNFSDDYWLKPNYFIVVSSRDLNDSSLPPMWVDISDRIKDEMQKIKSKMAELSKFQAKALLPNFDNAGNPNEENIEQLTREITVSLKRCERDLFRMSDKGKSAGSELDIVAKNIQVSVSSDLMLWLKLSEG